MQKRFEASAVVVLAALVAFASTRALSQQQTSAERNARFLQMSKDFEAKGLAEPFRGVTTDGQAVPGLYK
ncbi:MAG: hypothetical protein ACHQM7_10150, partial [Vicinamibacterales bacterium]